MNKYTLGTILGTTLLGLIKNKFGSQKKLGVGRFYTIVLDNILIKEAKDSNLSGVELSDKIEYKLRKLILGNERDQELINILKPIIFPTSSGFNFRHSFATTVDKLWSNRCESTEPSELGEDMEICKYEVRIVFASVRDESNLPENEDRIIMKKIESLVKDSISSYVDIHGCDFEPIMNKSEFTIHKGVQDHYDPRNRHETLSIETTDGTWEPFENNTIPSRLRRR